jgi:hypothetical protein
MATRVRFDPDSPGILIGSMLVGSLWRVVACCDGCGV